MEEEIIHWCILHINQPKCGWQQFTIDFGQNALALDRLHPPPFIKFTSHLCFVQQISNIVSASSA
jgi:hypothetical protein